MKKSHVKHIGPLVLLGALLLAGCAPAAAATPVALTQAPVDPTDTPTEAPTAVPTEAEPESAWEAVAETQADSAIRMSAFLDGEIGYWGGQGAAGQARYTTDGGATWTLADTSGG